MRGFATDIGSKADIGAPPLTQLSVKSTRPSRPRAPRRRLTSPESPPRESDTCVRFATIVRDAGGEIALARATSFSGAGPAARCVSALTTGAAELRQV